MRLVFARFILIFFSTPTFFSLLSHFPPCSPYSLSIIISVYSTISPVRTLSSASLPSSPFFYSFLLFFLTAPFSIIFPPPFSLCATPTSVIHCCIFRFPHFLFCYKNFFDVTIVRKPLNSTSKITFTFAHDPVFVFLLCSCPLSSSCCPLRYAELDAKSSQTCSSICDLFVNLNSECAWTQHNVCKHLHFCSGHILSSHRSCRPNYLQFININDNATVTLTLSNILYRLFSSSTS